MQLSLASVKVMLAMPTHRDFPPQTVVSLMETQHALLQRGIPHQVEIQFGGSLPHHARTKLAWSFLQSDCTHLFWVDSDMVWRAGDFVKLLAFGTKMECVGAAYAQRRDPPQIYIGVDEALEYKSNECGCIPVSGMGLGFTVMQRKLMQELSDRAERVEFPDVEDGPIPYIFECSKKHGRARGEDMAIFQDIAELGYQVWLDPSITLGHVGQKEYRASIADHLVHAEAAE